MGDVALTLPVLKGFLKANPNARITLITRKFFSPFFSGVDGVQIVSPDLKGRHKGFFGILRFASELRKKACYTHVIDLHSVIRSVIIRKLFGLRGVKTYGLTKNRKEKKNLLGASTEPKLHHTIHRYAKVFEQAGFSVILPEGKAMQYSNEANIEIKTFMQEQGLGSNKLVGIAPFAKHPLKIWPQTKVEQLLKKLEGEPGVMVLLFGGGQEEMEKLKSLSVKYSNCLVPNVGFKNELALMSHLSVMLSMDSSNMHLASLLGIPVVSIWGATHPGIGFSAWGQPKENSIQIPKQDLPCRPCTIYGKGSCQRGDFACMEEISVDRVILALKKYL